MIQINHMTSPMLALKPCLFDITCTTGNGTPFGFRRARHEIIFGESFTIGGESVVITWVETDATSGKIQFDTETEINVDKNQPETVPSETSLPIWKSELFTFTEWVKKLANKMSQHLILANFFTVSVTGNIITLTVLESASESTVSVINFSATVNNVTAAEILAENHRALIKVSSGSQLCSIRTVPNSLGKIRVNFSEMLKNFLLIKLNPVRADLSQPTKYAPFRCIVRTAEEGGVPITQGSWTWHPTVPILYADTVQPLPHLPMTIPDGQIHDWNDPVFLSWINPNNAAVWVGVEWELHDGYQITTRISPNILEVAHLETVVIPVFQNVTNNTIRVRIRLIMNGVTPLTQWRTYHRDFLGNPHSKHLMFLNHFGTWETVKFVGSTVFSMEVKKVDALRFTADDTIETVSSHPKWNRTFIYHTGWISKAMSFALEHLGSSPLVYEIDKLKGFIKLNITDKKFTPGDEEAEIASWEIKATPVQESDAPTDFLKKW